MNEPALSGESLAQDESLWNRAPAWRNLAVAATLLTAAAAALPLALPQAPQPGAPVIHKSVPAPHIQAPAVASAPVQQPAHMAIAPAQPLPEAASSSCPLTMATAPRHLGTATVVGFISPQQSLQVFERNGEGRGAPADPAYLGYTRLLIHVEGAPDGITRGTLAAPGTHIAIGDRVTFDSAYRDPSGACQWIPTLVTADLGQPDLGRPANSSAIVAPGAAASGATPATAELPVGALVIPSGTLTRVNRHNRYIGTQDVPVTITVITPPAHGTVTTANGTALLTVAPGVQRNSQVTEVYYQSNPGYTGKDSFTYKRTSTDPNDPRNGNTYTMVVDVK